MREAGREAGAVGGGWRSAPASSQAQPHPPVGMMPTAPPFSASTTVSSRHESEASGSTCTNCCCCRRPDARSGALAAAAAVVVSCCRPCGRWPCIACKLLPWPAAALQRAANDAQGRAGTSRTAAAAAAAHAAMLLVLPLRRSKGEPSLW